MGRYPLQRSSDKGYGSERNQTPERKGNKLSQLIHIHNYENRVTWLTTSSTQTL